MDVLIHLANLLILSSYLVRDMLALRAIAVVASVAFAAYFFFQQTIIWPPIGWNTLFAIVNLTQGVMLVRERRAGKLTVDETAIWQRNFAHMEPLRAGKLLRAARRERLQTGAALLREGQSVDRLLLVLSGEAIVEVRGMTVARCEGGDFLGEIAFADGSPASATVLVADEVDALWWPRGELNTLLDEEPMLRAGLHAAVASNLAGKLRKKSESSLDLADAQTRAVNPTVR